MHLTVWLKEDIIENSHRSFSPLDIMGRGYACSGSINRVSNRLLRDGTTSWAYLFNILLVYVYANIF